MKLSSSYLLWPFSLIYGAVVCVRNKLFDWNIFKSYKPKVKTISVGNITVGGTGKTPHAMFILEHLKKSKKVAYLSRGYGRQTKGYAEVLVESNVLNVGDEALLVKSRFPDIPVGVCERRKIGIVQLIQSYPDLEVIILDDAFQHRWVEVDLNLVLMDYTRPIYNDWLLPAGRLRDSKATLKRADAVIVTKCPAEMHLEMMHNIQRKLHIDSPLFASKIIYDKPRSFDMDNELKVVQGMKVVLFTGIANVEPLLVELGKQKLDVICIEFKDHHQFVSKDFKHIQMVFEELPDENKILMTTEKDLMRFKRQNAFSEQVIQKMYYIPISIKILFDAQVEFTNWLNLE